MDADLTEIALNALEAAESADEKDTSNGDDGGGDEKDTGAEYTGESETTNEEETSEETDEGEDEADESDDGDEEDNEEGEDNASDDDNNDNDSSSDSESGKSDKTSKSVKKKEEMSDDEFEELAKKRGYSKTPTDADKKAEEEAQKRAAAEKAQFERMTRKPAEVPQEVWDDTPDNNKIVYNNLPIITARGANGKTVNVKLPDQLPADFKFEDEKARAEFMTAMQEQSNRMNGMLNALNARDERMKQEEARLAEAHRTVDAVKALQKSGALPTPKAEYGTKEFDNDPAVKTINNVLNYRVERARQGVNLTVEDALTLYKSAHPDEFKKTETKKADTKAKGDEERKKVAQKIAGGKKSTNKSASDKAKGEHKYYKFGMSTQDVLDRALEDLD